MKKKRPTEMEDMQQEMKPGPWVPAEEREHIDVSKLKHITKYWCVYNAEKKLVAKFSNEQMAAAYRTKPGFTVKEEDLEDTMRPM